MIRKGGGGETGKKRRQVENVHLLRHGSVRNMSTRTYSTCIPVLINPLETVSREAVRVFLSSWAFTNHPDDCIKTRQRKKLVAFKLFREQKRI